MSIMDNILYANGHSGLVFVQSIEVMKKENVKIQNEDEGKIMACSDVLIHFSYSTL